MKHYSRNSSPMSKTPFGWLLVTKHSNEYKKRRLIEEAERAAIDLRVVTPDQFLLQSTSSKNVIRDIQTGTPIEELPTFVISLVVVEEKDPQAFVLMEHLAALDLLLINNPTSVRHANDKMATYRTAAKMQIRIPTTFLHIPGTLLTLQEHIQYPCVIKPNKGLKGTGVELVQNVEDLTTHLNTVSEPTLVQEAIAESSGKDVRVLMLGNKPLGSMLRESNTSFTSNIATGGSAKMTTINPSYVDIATALLKKMTITFGSVDFLYGKDEMVLCEVNANPGLKMFEAVSNRNIAKEILLYCTKQSHTS